MSDNPYSPKYDAYNQKRTDAGLKRRQDEENLANRSDAERSFDELRSEIAAVGNKLDALQFVCGEGIDITGNAPSFSANITSPASSQQNVDPVPLDLTVYDTNETTILHTGKDTEFISVDDLTPPTQVQVYWIKTDICVGGTTLHTYVKRSLSA